MGTTQRSARPYGKPSATTNEPSANTNQLVRRLMIRCPVTSRVSDTGLEITAMPRVTGARNLLVDCLECGQDHEWTVNDIRLQ